MDHIPKLRPRGGKEYMDYWDATHVLIPIAQEGQTPILIQRTEDEDGGS